jgi:uncharacterized membrane protein
MKRLATIFFFILCIASTQVSCKHEIPVLSRTNPNDTIIIPPQGSAVCFESDVLPLFQSNCAKSGCHDAASRSDGYRLDSYANIVVNGITPGNAVQSKIYEVLIDNDPSDRMPQAPNAPLTMAQINTIATWINEGARNTTNCAAICDSSQFAYSLGVKPILQTYCLGCHAGTAVAGGGIQLGDYTSVKAQVSTGNLYNAISHTGSASPMPKNASKLSDCNIAIIRKWIEAGSPNN